MAKGVHNISSWGSGLWSPKLDGRVDQAKYASAMRQCLNVIPYKSGPWTRRPGTQFMGLAKYATNNSTNNYAVREMPFTFSPDTTFNLEWGHQYVRFWANGQRVIVSSANLWVSGTNYVLGNFVEDPGDSNNIYYCILSIANDTTEPHLDSTHWVKQSIYEVPTPYNGNFGSAGAQPGTPFDTDVFLIFPCQINDVIYLAHPDYPPYSLTRFGNTDWVLEQVPFLSPALLDQNATDTSITPSALQGNNITLTATAPAWVAENYYNIGNSVQVSGIIYNCVLANVSSGSFATDLAAGYWEAIGIFNPNHEGSTWQLATLRDSAYVEYDGVASTGFAAGTSSQIQALGSWEVHTYGVWSADIAIQRSLDGGQTWDTVRSVTGRSDRNLDLTGTAAQLGIYQIVVSNVAMPVDPGATNPRVVFEVVDAFLYGLVYITTVTPIEPALFVNGTAYQISTFGTSVNWVAMGAPANPQVGTIFSYNGTAPTGTGGLAFVPYVAQANVVTQLSDPNGLAPQWVNGNSYVSGDMASYNFVNYTTSYTGVSTIPPPQDTNNWSPTAPGGTEYWSEAAWSNYRGFPQAVASFQQRIIYGSSGYEPQRIWGTVTNDIENFALGDQTLATDSFAFDLNAPGRGPIVWLIGQTDLFAGFSGAEWVINSGSASTTSGNSGAAITPTSINAVEHGTFGSAPFVQPAIIGNACVFTQRQADAIRQMLFSIETTKYMSTDLTTLADHLFNSGVVQIAYQQRWRHQGIIWAITQQGTLCGLTYDLDQQVYGWHQHMTGANQTDANGNPVTNDNGFESVSVIDGQGSNDDEVWVTVNRLIGGVQTRFIERINPFNWEEVFTVAPNPPAPVLADAFYVDCGSTIYNPGTLTLTNANLVALAGRTVCGLADGYAFNNLLVSGGGSVTLPSSIPTTVGTVQIGLPIFYAGQPMRFDSDPMQGNTQGRKKALDTSNTYVRVWNSLGGSVSNGTTQYPIWTSGMAYALGAYTRSPSTLGSFQCTVANSGTTDPANSSQWMACPTPTYNPPSPIQYPVTSSLPFAAPALITEPTDIEIHPFPNPSPDTDPIVIIQGNDALPLTCLGMFLKPNVMSAP